MRYNSIRPGKTWLDTDGKRIQAHGGSVFYENGIYYGDYMYFFLLMGVTSSETYSAILLRTGDLIEANMKKMGKQNFDLSKSRCYFSLNAELKVKPLLLELPIVNSMKGVDTNTVTESSAWCTYKLSSVRGYS